MTKIYAELPGGDHMLKGFEKAWYIDQPSFNASWAFAKWGWQAATERALRAVDEILAEEDKAAHCMCPEIRRMILEDESL